VLSRHEIAGGNALASIAFPSISTGIYGYPIDLAAKVAVGTVRASLARFPGLHDVIFCCFSEGDLAIYEGLLGHAAGQRGGRA
jgi:O-acetyl-ADP-ribose deacetylase (regulator of RNase III)